MSHLEEEEDISNDEPKSGFIAFLLRLLGRILFRQGYIDLATISIGTYEALS